MLAEIQKVVAIVLAVLGAVSATTNVDVTHIQPILTKLSALIGTLSNLRQPTNIDSAVTDLTTTLAGLRASGVITNSAPIDEALAAIQKFTQVEHDYTSGQAALITNNFSFGGVAGDLIAVAKGGPAAKALGLA